MIAVVTGGCSGLGLEFSKYLANSGYTVYALYNKSIDNALLLEDEYSNVRAIKCDIRDENEVDKVLFNIGDIDILINNAGIAKDNSYQDKTKKEFMSVLETNVVGTFLVIKYAIDKMNKNGIIINISSNNAIDAHTSLSYDYDASKAGINMLTKDFALAIEEEKKDLVIVSICPGWINTDAVNSMNPDYLKQELKRTRQKELLDKGELVKYVIDNIKSYKNGEVVVVKELEK